MTKQDRARLKYLRKSGKLKEEMDAFREQAIEKSRSCEGLKPLMTNSEFQELCKLRNDG
jgi:hypothetical protein